MCASQVLPATSARVLLVKRPDVPRPGTDPGKWDALPAACHSLDEAGRDPRLARLSKKRQRSRSADVLEAGNFRKLMPRFGDAQAKTGSHTVSSNRLLSPQGFAIQSRLGEHKICTNVAHRPLCARSAHDRHAVFAATPIFPLEHRLSGCPSQPRISPLRRAAEDTFE